MPGAIGARHLTQPVLHQDAVLLAHRHDVRDRAQRNEVEPAAQIGELAPPLLAQLHAHSKRKVEGDAGAAETAEREAAVGFDRVEDGAGGQRPTRDLVVIADDDFEPALTGQPDLAVRRTAAVDGDDEAGALLRKSPHAAVVQAVAVADAVRDVEDGLVAEGA